MGSAEGAAAEGCTLRASAANQEPCWDERFKRRGCVGDAVRRRGESPSRSRLTVAQFLVPAVSCQLPAHEGVWLDDDESGSPATPQFGKPDPEYAVSVAEAAPFGGMADEGELLGQSQVLRDQRCLGSGKKSKNDPDEIGQKHTVFRLRRQAGDAGGACLGVSQRGDSRLDSAGMDFPGGTTLRTPGSA